MGIFWSICEQYGQFCGKEEKDKLEVEVGGGPGGSQDGSGAYILAGNALALDSSDLMITQCLAASPSNSASMDSATQALLLPPDAGAAAGGTTAAQAAAGNSNTQDAENESSSRDGETGKRVLIGAGGRRVVAQLPHLFPVEVQRVAASAGFIGSALFRSNFRMFLLLTRAANVPGLLVV